MTIILDGTAGITTPDLTDTSLTSGRVVYAGASGNLTGSAGLTFDGSSIFAAPRVRLSDANRLDWGDGGEWIVGDNGGAMLFGVDAAEKMRLTSTGLGIGTSSPVTKLTVVGNIKAGYEPATGIVIGLAPSGVPSNDVNAYVLWGDAASFGGNNGDLIYVPRTSTSADHRFYTGNVGLATEKMRISYTGNVGIGTTSPSAKLSFGGGYISTDKPNLIRLYDDGTDAGSYGFGVNGAKDGVGQLGIYSGTVGTIGFYTSSGTERARIGSDGQLMVGTTAGNSSAGGIHATGPILQGAAGLYQQQISINSGKKIQSLVLGVGYSDLLLNELGGNVLVGTPDSISGFFPTKLKIDAAGTNGVGVRVNTAGEASYSSWHSTDSGTRYHCYFYDGSTRVQRGSISSNGSSTSYNTSSDYRLKNSIAPMTGALARVALLKPVTYKWSADNSDGEGFIAHELAEVVPQCVTGEKDAVDADGNPKYQGIDTSFLIATLTAAIQELKAEFDAYKASHP